MNRFNLKDTLHRPGSLINSLMRTYQDSVELLDGEVLIPRSDRRYSVSPLISPTNSNMPTDNGTLTIFKIPERRSVIGVDSTAVPLAEGKSGLVFALRAAIVQRSIDGRYSVQRCGPFIAYVTTELIKAMTEEFDIPKKLAKLAPVEPRYARKLLLESLEFSIVWELASSVRETIIVRDGSLSEPAVQSRSKPFRKLMREGLRRGNMLIGVSKRSRLFKWMFDKLICLTHLDPPAAVAVPEATTYDSRVSGEVFFALFSRSGIPLRIDLISLRSPEETLCMLYASDSFKRGYPETIRRAHIYSKLTGVEKMGIDLSLRRMSRVTNWGEERELLFGAFNKSSREWGE